MWIELVGHMTYLLLAVSYLVRDLVWLRRIAIPASLCSITFNYFAPAEPLWLIINWNLVFLAVNVSQLAMIYCNDRKIHSNPRLSELAEFLSPPLSATDILRLDEWGEHLTISEGEEAKFVYLLLDGWVSAWRAGERLGACYRGTFLGEMSFLTGNNCSATLEAENLLSVYRWKQQVLYSQMDRYPELRVGLQQLLATNLSNQFVNRELESDRKKSGATQFSSATISAASASPLTGR
jgi:CRP-like cAMP-binding protein